MKRSEMLQSIRSILLGTPIDHVNFDEQILKTVEELGMTPPKIIVHPNSYNRSEGTYGYEVNEWEPENE